MWTNTLQLQLMRVARHTMPRAHSNTTSTSPKLRLSFTKSCWESKFQSSLKIVSKENSSRQRRRLPRPRISSSCLTVAVTSNPHSACNTASLLATSVTASFDCTNKWDKKLDVTYNTRANMKPLTFCKDSVSLGVDWELSSKIRADIRATIYTFKFRWWWKLFLPFSFTHAHTSSRTHFCSILSLILLRCLSRGTYPPPSLSCLPLLDAKGSTSSQTTSQWQSIRTSLYWSVMHEPGNKRHCSWERKCPHLSGDASLHLYGFIFVHVPKLLENFNPLFKFWHKLFQ